MDLRPIGHEDRFVRFGDGHVITMKLAQERERDVIARADDDAMDIRNDGAVFQEDPAGNRVEDISKLRCLIHGRTFERANLARKARRTGREQRRWKVKGASSGKLVDAIRLRAKFASDIRRRDTRADQKDVLVARSGQCVFRARAPWHRLS